MDGFVRNKLTEWGLSQWIKRYKEQGIDTERLYCLDDQQIADLIPTVGPRSKFKKKLKLLKEQNTANPETDLSAQVCPSTSDTSDKGKRKLDLQDESSQCQPPTKKQRLSGSYSEEIILSKVKNIQDNKFLTKQISDLETDERKVVDVFGKTGAGKSSLINAVIGEKNLLTSENNSACTSVMIKMEANLQNSKYEANIEFITNETKTKLNKIICERKKTIYSSLTTRIETNMQKCYDDAKQINGPGMLSKMRETIKKHVLGSKDVMFQDAKDVMLKQLKDLMRDILEDLKESMQESIKLSLNTDGVSIPDYTLELKMVKDHYKELQGSSDQEPLICAGPPRRQLHS